jgi:thiosulfate dehydrogenase
VAPPDLSAVGDDPFGKLVKYGHQLFTNTPKVIGPMVSDTSRRLAGNNLACGNCHLQAGAQPYAMPMIGVWGQFPQYRAREGAVVSLEERINGCMQRSMHGRALSLDSREMKAFSAYMRWLSEGVPDGAMLLGAGTLQIKEPMRAADAGRGAEVYAQVCAACHSVNGLGQRAQNGTSKPMTSPASLLAMTGRRRRISTRIFRSACKSRSTAHTVLTWTAFLHSSIHSAPSLQFGPG